MTIVRTLKEGVKVADRIILEIDDASTPSPDPILADKGFQVSGSRGATFLHVYVKFTGTVTAATVTPWFFSTIAGEWFEGNLLSFNLTTKIAIVQTEGEEVPFFVIDSISGAGNVQIWAGYSWGMYQHQ